jgi:hypothetical protein
MSSPSSSLPATIRALKTQPGGKLAVIDVPFASREDLQELGSDFVLVRTTPFLCTWPSPSKKAFEKANALPRSVWCCICLGVYVDQDARCRSQPYGLEARFRSLVAA